MPQVPERICLSHPDSINSPRLKQTNNGRMAGLAVSVFVLDQLTKLAVLKWLPTEYVSEKSVLPGFFRLVHWRNTGAAWSMFHDNNLTLAIISAIALVVLIVARQRFHSHLTLGW